jgi:EAL domain-containing protein (putative c-di-GMP-specific phosphodiesterase class I)
MPLVEATPHVDSIGAWVLQQSCQLTARLLAEGAVDDTFHVSVNVASRQLYSESFVQTIKRELGCSGIPPRCLILEITESSFLDIDHAVPTLHALRALGVRLAVDDFGTGYSSLSYLDRLPVDILKIDRSFVADIDQGSRPGVMTRAILSLADTLGLITVAEGVERQSQLQELRANGCVAAQGYLWSPPVPELELRSVIHKTSTPIRGELAAGGPGR